MRKAEQARHWFIKTALSYLGTPYIWGGDDPSGFDCSGFVIECLKSADKLPKGYDHTADGLMRYFGSPIPIIKPNEGVLAFYLNNEGRATHVVICLDEYFQIGASGGTSNTNDPKEAWRNNAFIKIRPIPIPIRLIIFCDPFRNIS